VESDWFLAYVNQRPYYVAKNDAEVQQILKDKGIVTLPCEGPRHNLPGLCCATDALGQKVLLPSPFSPPPSLNYRDFSAVGRGVRE
jgi:hypothetical protein